MIYLIGLVWIVSAVLSFGFSFNYYQTAYPSIAKKDWLADTIFCFIVCLFGPTTLLTFFLYFFIGDLTQSLRSCSSRGRSSPSPEVL